MAKFTITVQYLKEPSEKYETNDESVAKQIKKREIAKAKATGSVAQAVFYNNRLVWRKR